jgi:DNA-binding CsgD family transcriptional regulator
VLHDVAQQPLPSEHRGATRLGRARAVRIRSLDTAVGGTVAALLSQDGWDVVAWDDGPDGALSIVMTPPSAATPSAARLLLVCGRSAVACAEAMGLLWRGAVGGVVSDDHLVLVSGVLDALDARQCLLSADLLERVRRVPALDERQRDVLARRLAGHSRARIALDLHVSVSTIKRVVSELNDLFVVTSPDQLARTALELGFKAGQAPSGLS